MPREATILNLKGVSNRKMDGTFKTIFTVKSLKKVLRIINPILSVDPLGRAGTNFFYSAFLSKRNDILLLDRPLLAVTRNDVKKICYVWQLPIHPDASNQNLFYGRNRIRKQLLPTLRFYFNRQLDGMFFQFTKLTSTEQLYIEYVSQRLFPSLCVVTREYLAFQIGGLKHLPLAIRRQILKRGLERYATRSLHLFHIEHLCRLMEKKRLQSHRFLRESSLCLLPIRTRFTKGVSRKARSESPKVSRTRFTSGDSLRERSPLRFTSDSFRERSGLLTRGARSDTFGDAKRARVRTSEVKEKNPFRDEKQRTGNQQVEDATLLGDKIVFSSLHQLSSLRRKRSDGKQKCMTQYVKGLKRVKKASLSREAVTFNLSLLSFAREVTPEVSLRERVTEGEACFSRFSQSEREKRAKRIPVGDTGGAGESEPSEVSSKVLSTGIPLLKGRMEGRNEKTSALFNKGVASLALREAREARSERDATPTTLAIWVHNRKARLTTASFQRPSISLSQNVFLQSPCLIKIAGLDKMIKEWNFRFGMPTHQFLPTTGSLLFLEQGFLLVGQG